MSDTEGDGPALARYVDVLRGDQSVRKWADSRGIDHASISRWRSGDKPLISTLREFAIAIGRPLTEILIVAGYATPEDFGGVEPPAPRPPSVAEAIDYDPTLGPHVKLALHNILEMAGAMTPRDGVEPHGGKVEIRAAQ